MTVRRPSARPPRVGGLELPGHGLEEARDFGDGQLVEVLASAAAYRVPHLALVEALLAPQLDDRAAQGGSRVAGGGVAVEAVAELVAVTPQGALEGVRDGALVGRLVALRRLLDDGVEAHVRARRGAGDGHAHGGGVGAHAPRLARLRVYALALAEGDVTNELVAPATEPENAVGLVDGGAPLEVGEGASAPALAVGDESLVEGLAQLLPSTAGGSPSQRRSCSSRATGLGMGAVAAPDDGVMVPFCMVLSPWWVSCCVDDFVAGLP